MADVQAICPKCSHVFDLPFTFKDIVEVKKTPTGVRCRAIKRTGAPCRQKTDLDEDGYCKYHQTPKYKTPPPPPPPQDEGTPLRLIE